MQVYAYSFCLFEHMGHRLYTNSAHTCNSNKEGGLSLVSHTNEQRSRNNRNQPCLCSPTVSHCPALALFTYISMSEYNKDTYCSHPITLWLCSTVSHKSSVYFVVKGKAKTWDRQNMPQRNNVSLFHNICTRSICLSTRGINDCMLCTKPFSIEH